MKKHSLLKISFTAAVILLSGIFYQSQAQVVVVSRTEKKSKPANLSPNRKSIHPVVIRNENRLPPGQQKKIYGAKSAKQFAPGQRKKTHKKYRHHSKHKKHHGKK